MANFNSVICLSIVSAIIIFINLNSRCIIPSLLVFRNVSSSLFFLFSFPSSASSYPILSPLILTYSLYLPFNLLLIFHLHAHPHHHSSTSSPPDPYSHPHNPSSCISPHPYDYPHCYPHPHFILIFFYPYPPSFLLGSHLVASQILADVGLRGCSSKELSLSVLQSGSLRFNAVLTCRDKCVCYIGILI